MDQGGSRRRLVAGEPWSIVPSDATVFCLLACAVALLMINLAPRWSLATGIIVLIAATPAMFRILGLLLLRGAPDETSPLNTMALHSDADRAVPRSICVMLHPRLGFAKVVLQSSLRGKAAPARPAAGRVAAGRGGRI